MQHQPKKPPAPRTPMFPRDAAVSFKVPATVDGPITIMCNHPDFLEVYTAHETFKLQTPENIDPGRTNPNAMFINARTHGVGSASAVVARTFIMAHQMLNERPLPDDQSNAVRACMHSIKEGLLQCDEAAARFLDALSAEMAAVEATGYRLAPGGRAIERFPVLPNFEGLVTAVLIAARRGITEICTLPGHFWQLTRPHNNVAHLIGELEPRLGAGHRLIGFLRECLPAIKAIIDTRNGQEHSATTQQRTVLRNFTMTPNNEIVPPTWHLEGEDPTEIGPDVQIIRELLVNFAEGVFLHCLESNLPTWPPYRLEAIEPIDIACPVRFRLRISAEDLYAMQQDRAAEQ